MHASPTPPVTTSVKRRFVRAAKLVLAGLGVVLASVGGFYAYLQVTHNFHEVEAGQYYRSAQLAPDDLTTLIHRHGIRSVLNLRGTNTGKDWYDEEIAASTRVGVTHLDYAISARIPVTLQQIADIEALIDKAPKPILVHCWDGADRTGLITAVYRLSRGSDVMVAEQELSLRYGHFPYLGSKSRAMDDSFAAYVASHSLTPQSNSGFARP